MRITPLSEENVDAWAALFDASGSACFCRYWHFEGGKNDWLARSFGDPGANRAEQVARVREGSLEARGLVAIGGDDAVGWMKLAPRASLLKLQRQGAYRGVDLGPDDGVWSIGCLLIHPAHRRRGVGRALVVAAPEHVRSWGGRFVEAYPHRVPHAQHDEEAWMGPYGLYERLGYARVHDDGPYPVVRRAV
jgi:GNAT superfamily N-acetyltransferase